jgi:hypothetical protein
MSRLKSLLGRSVMTAVLILISTAITRGQFRGDTLPIPGNPPLTEDIVGKASHFFEWLLDAHLTLEQRAQFRESLVQSWKHHRQDDIDGTMAVLNFRDQVNQKTPEERELIREALRQKYLDLLRRTPQNVLSRWVLNIYDSAHRPIANGNPPLTLQVADAYAEFVAFLVTECSSQKAFNPDRHFKDALAQGLAAQYSSYSPEQQRQFAQMPLLWDALRFKWAQLSEPERANYRKQWAPAVQTLLASARGSGSGAAASSGGIPQGLQDRFSSEHLFVNSMANSSFTSTMNLHLSMWK